MKPVFDSFTEPTTDRRKFMLGIAFAAAAGVAAWRLPNRHLDYLGHDKLDDLVPKAIGPWDFVAASGLVVPPEDQLVKALYTQLLTRVYSDGVNPPIMLLIAQSGSQIGLSPDPPAGNVLHGGRLSDQRLGSASNPNWFQEVLANSIDASAGGPPNTSSFGPASAIDMPTSWKEQKLAVAEQNLRGHHSRRYPGAHIDDWRRQRCCPRTIDAFAQAMIASISPAEALRLHCLNLRSGSFRIRA